MEITQELFSSFIFDEEEENNKINILQTGKIKEISENFRLSRKASFQMKKSESLQFDEELNLNLAIDKLLEALQKVKVRLIECDNTQQILETPETKDFKEQFLKAIKQYHKTLLLRQSQIGALIYMVQNQKEIGFLKDYEEKYGMLGQFIIQPQKNNQPINVFILEEEMERQKEFLEEYKDMIDLLRLNIVHKKYLGNMDSLVKASNRLKILNSKIVTIAEIFPYACTLDREDLFSFYKTSKRWTDLTSHSITHRFYGDSKTVRESFDKLKSSLNLINALMSLLNKSKLHCLNNDWNKLWANTNQILKCAFFPSNATHEAQVLISEPDGKLAKEIWNLPEDKMFRGFIKSLLPWIEFSNQYYIPRIFEQYLIETKLLDEAPLIPELQIKNVHFYFKEINENTNYKEKVPIRINCPYSLKQRYEQPNNANWWFSSFFKKNYRTPEAVIFHIHGGGFISMSSFIHQTYLRIWANNLQVPIVSVDYGKAPEHPYPEGLNDCFEAYMWTLYQFRQIFHAEPVKVILVGDSAGGNLVAALTNLLIKNKLKIPDGICLVYPALNLNYNNYTPSLLTALDDMILPHTFLKICLSSYIKSGNSPESDPLLSPIVAGDDIFKKYPKTRIFVGSKDPFHDDCCRLTEKLNNLQSDICKLTIFDQFPHGFLQFDLKAQPHENCRKATKQVEDSLRELLQS